MKNVEIHRYETRLDKLFEEIKNLPDDNDWLKSHWSRYLCVLAAGYLETAVCEIYVDYAKHAPPNVRKFVESHLRRFQNPNMEKILQLTGAFSTEWADSLQVEAEGQLKDAVDSIVNLRNQIAHGKDSGISFSQIKSYYAAGKRLVAVIDKQCNP